MISSRPYGIMLKCAAAALRCSSVRRRGWNSAFRIFIRSTIFGEPLTLTISCRPGQISMT